MSSCYAASALAPFVYSTTDGAIEFTESAGKHGFSREDAMWAIEHAHYVEREFDVARVPGRLRPTLFIGPSRTPARPLLEVMVAVIPPGTVVVFHVMAARKKHLDRMHDQA